MAGEADEASGEALQLFLHAVDPVECFLGIGSLQDAGQLARAVLEVLDDLGEYFVGACARCGGGRRAAGGGGLYGGCGGPGWRGFGV